MPKLMTRGEMIKRVKRGDDPDDLVEEKWWRMEQAVIGGYSPTYLQISSATCAWCFLHFENGCKTCPYYIHFGLDCTARHWNPHARDKLKAIRLGLGAIRAIRKEKRNRRRREERVDTAAE